MLRQFIEFLDVRHSREVYRHRVTLDITIGSALSVMAAQLYAKYEPHRATANPVLTSIKPPSPRITNIRI